MSLPRPSTRIRRVAASTGALALAGVLALSGVVSGGVDMTDAAWNDTEVAQASVKASWTTGFARVTGGSFVYQDASGESTPNSPAEGLTRITGMGTDQVPTPAPPGVRGDNVWLTPQDKSEVAPTNGSSPSFPPRNDAGVRISRSVNPYVYPSIRNYPINANYCLSYGSDPTSATNHCTDTSGTGARAEAKYTATDMNVRIIHDSLSPVSRAGRFIARGTTATVRCFDDGRPNTAEANPGILELARSTGANNDAFTSASTLSAVLPGATGVPSDSPSSATDGYGHWFRKNTLQDQFGVLTPYAFVLVAQPRVNTYVQDDPPYALAEVSATIQIYADAFIETRGQYLRSIDVVVARAECGLSQGGTALPSRSGTYRGEARQAPWPNPIYLLPEDVGSASTGPLNPQPSGLSFQPTVSGRAAALGTIPDESAAATIRHESEFTASETTNSAPPDPTGDDESPSAGTSTAATSTTRRTTTVTTTPTASAAPTSTTTPPATKTVTTTSAAPAVVIPDEPGPLSPAARLEGVGTVTIDGEDLDVVVNGTSVPTDAQQGLAALEIWLGGGDPGTTWETFASTDPDSNGWRWAAISQKTGTVVYIR